MPTLPGLFDEHDLLLVQDLQESMTSQQILPYLQQSDSILPQQLECQAMQKNKSSFRSLQHNITDPYQILENSPQLPSRYPSPERCSLIFDVSKLLFLHQFLYTAAFSSAYFSETLHQLKQHRKLLLLFTKIT